MPRFAANLSMMFNEWEFLDRFEAAASAGFEAVEYLFPYAFDREEIRERLKRHDLTQALFNLPPGNWEGGERGLAALADRRDEFRASVTTALDYAEATGVSRMHVMSGIAERGSAQADTAYRDSLRFACEAAHARGLDILIEPINPRDMPGYYLNDFNFAADLIADLDLPNLRLQFDIYHRQIIHGDVMKGLEAMMPIIGHVQTAAVPLRNEPGTGELDDARVLRYLDTLGYDGFVGCEYRPAGATLDGLAWRAALGL